MTAEVAVKRRVLKWVLARRGEATFIGPGPVVAGEIQNQHAVLWTLEDDIMQALADEGWAILREEQQLLEEGRQLASERDDLIAKGGDPVELLPPLAPIAVDVVVPGRWVRTFRTGIPVPAGATHLISCGEGDGIRHVFEVDKPRGQEQP